MGPRLRGALLSASVVSFAPATWAQVILPAGVSVDWAAPESCPNEASVKASIASLLTASSAKGEGGPLSFRGLVSTSDGRFHLEVRARSAAGEETKSLDGLTCSTLADAFALMVAYAVDPHLAEQERPPPPPPRLELTPPPAPSGPHAVAPSEEPAAPTRWAIGAVGAAGRRRGARTQRGH